MLLGVRVADYIGVHIVASVHGGHGVSSNYLNSNGPGLPTMITETIGKYLVKRCDSAYELTIERYNLFNQFALYDSEVGHTLEDVAKHMHGINRFIKMEKPEDAVQCSNHLKQVFFHIFNHDNFPALQWMTLVHTIDDKPLENYSTDYLKEWCKLLSNEGLTQGKAMKDIDDSKKKSGLN